MLIYSDNIQAWYQKMYFEFRIAYLRKLISGWAFIVVFDANENDHHNIYARYDLYVRHNQSFSRGTCT